ncbi:outer membrane protein assembly factor BamB family protein [Oerskovia turbata]
MGRRARGDRASVRVIPLDELGPDEEPAAPPVPAAGPHALSADGETPDGGARLASSASGSWSPGPSESAAAPGTEARAGRPRWSRRTRLAVGAAAAVLALVAVGGVVRGEASEAARLERVVAAGGLRPLDADAGVVWRVDARESRDFNATWWYHLVVTDAALVMVDEEVSGYDPVTGALLWRAPQEFAPSGPGQRAVVSCRGKEPAGVAPEALVCTSLAVAGVESPSEVNSHERPLGVQVIDPVTGEVTSSRAVEEGTEAATVVFGDALATARWGDPEHVVVTLEDLETGRARWTRELEVTPDPDEVGDQYLGLWLDGEVLRVEASGLSATVDETGETDVTTSADSWTMPLRDGRSVVQRVGGSASVLDADGRELLTTGGRVREFASTDGQPDKALFVSDGGGVMDVAGEVTRPRTTAVDPATGRALWHADGVLDLPVVQVGDVGILSGMGRLWAVDIGTGERLWESSQFRTVQWARTDGTDVYLIGSGTRGGSTITAVSVESGRDLWSVDLDDYVVQAVGADGRLVLQTQEGDLLGIG